MRGAVAPGSKILTPAKPEAISVTRLSQPYTVSQICYAANGREIRSLGSLLAIAGG